MKEKTITSSELKDFVNSDNFKFIVQKNHEKYKKMWLSWAEKKENISLSTHMSWNWCVFLFQPLWFLYRKMYREGAILLGLGLVSHFFTSLASTYLFEFLVNTSATVASNFTFFLWTSIYWIFVCVFSVLMVLMVIFSNVWYLKRCLKLASEANKQFETLSLENDALDETQQKKKNAFLEQVGGTSTKKLTFGYVVGLMVAYSLSSLLLYGILLGSLNIESIESNIESNTSSSVESVRGVVLTIDETVYLGNALESYPYFFNPVWEEFVTEQGRTIVRFTANYNFEKELVYMKEMGLQDAETYFEGFTDVKFVFDFSINLDGSDFNIYQAHFIVNGETNFTGKSDFGIKLLEYVYSPDPFLIILLSE